ncbi:MAG TPA: ROK family protein [Sphingobium sp.]|uniref:ROK family protein n=1 Tax=Sphingobium sp. TaxID=1912891 RepID=UPI002ED1763B
MALYGCLEAGGTKFVVGLVTDAGEIVASVRIPTTLPDETLGAAIDWLQAAAGDHGPLSALGIATFGPAGIDRARRDWGFITSTPKPGWRQTDMAGPLGQAFGLPVGFDTDVNGAALAESRWGAGRGERMLAYLTLGTGIGGGIVVDGHSLHGRTHSEMGHIAVRRDSADGGFAGICPFHGDCLEGLASGPAIMARWGRALSDLPSDHPGHGIIAGYVAQLCIALEAMVSPDRIIIGGGVAQTPGLLDRVRQRADIRSAGYFPGFDAARIVAPGLGSHSGLLGALALAQDALAP